MSPSLCRDSVAEMMTLDNDVTVHSKPGSRRIRIDERKCLFVVFFLLFFFFFCFFLFFFLFFFFFQMQLSKPILKRGLRFLMFEQRFSPFLREV